MAWLMLSAGVVCMAILLAMILATPGCMPSQRTIDKLVTQKMQEKEQEAKLQNPAYHEPNAPQTLTDKVNSVLGSRQDTRVIEKTIRSTDYLMTLFILATVLGAIAGMHGMKSGWIVAAGSVVGAGMKAAFSLTSVYVLSGLVFLCVIMGVLVIMTVRTVRMKAGVADKLSLAFTDVVHSVQGFKDKTRNLLDLEPFIKNTLDKELSKQMPETKELVSIVKEQLKDAAAATGSEEEAVPPTVSEPGESTEEGQDHA